MWLQLIITHSVTDTKILKLHQLLGRNMSTSPNWYPHFMAQLPCFCLFPCNENILHPRTRNEQNHFNYVKTLLCLQYSLSALYFILNLCTRGFMCNSAPTEVLPHIVLLITLLTLHCEDNKHTFDGYRFLKGKVYSKLGLKQSFLRNYSYTLLQVSRVMTNLLFYFYL